jgi:hypothetical protein
MTLAEAITILATAGCRIVADPSGGIALDVPPGSTVTSEVLAVLSAHREQLAAVATPAEATAGDLHQYLGTKGITGAAAELVEHAAATFNVKHQAITVDRDEVDAPPAFFEEGVPFITLVDTEWSAAGGGTSIIPGGSLGLAIPQVWAIDDRFERHGIEAILESIKRRKLPRHIPVWLDGHARVIEITLVDFEHAVATPGMNLMPWRPQTHERPRS